MARHCHEGSGPMARWVFTCKNCFKIVPHAEIGDTLTDFFFPKKPEIPSEGLETECPQCRTNPFINKMNSGMNGIDFSGSALPGFHVSLF
jgi:hypothetical protein